MELLGLAQGSDMGSLSAEFLEGRRCCRSDKEGWSWTGVRGVAVVESDPFSCFPGSGAWETAEAFRDENDGTGSSERDND